MADMEREELEKPQSRQTHKRKASGDLPEPSKPPKIPAPSLSLDEPDTDISSSISAKTPDSQQTKAANMSSFGYAMVRAQEESLSLPPLPPSPNKKRPCELISSSVGSACHIILRERVTPASRARNAITLTGRGSARLSSRHWLPRHARFLALAGFSAFARRACTPIRDDRMASPRQLMRLLILGRMATPRQLPSPLILEDRMRF